MPLAISQLRRDRQDSALARAHVQQSLIPSCDHLSSRERERKRRAALIRLIELDACGL